MARHIYIHFHDEQGRAPDGKFAAGGSGHALTKHPTDGAAVNSVNERHQGLASHGFKHEASKGSPDDVGGRVHHYAHPDGSRAVITHKADAITGRHSVISHINTMNQNKKKTTHPLNIPSGEHGMVDSGGHKD